MSLAASSAPIAMKRKAMNQSTKLKKLSVYVNYETRNIYNASQDKHQFKATKTAHSTEIPGREFESLSFDNSIIGLKTTLEHPCLIVIIFSP
jgi:hypothetical protein